MDVHGECPDLLAPASAYRRQGGGFWVASRRVRDRRRHRRVAAARPRTPSNWNGCTCNHRWRRKGLAAQLADLVERTAGERGATPGRAVERLPVHRRPPVLRAAGLRPRRPGPGAGRSEPDPRAPLREDPVVDRSPRYRAGGGVGVLLAGRFLRWPGGAVSAGRAGQVTRGLTSQAGPSARSAAAMSLIRSTAS